MSSEKLMAILEKTADINHIKNYEINLDDDALKGNGFLSESYTGYIKNKDTGELIQAYIKKMPPFPGPFGVSAYFNENLFYSSIWPELNKFQEEKRVRKPFTNIPKFYCGSSKPEEEYICMENLKIQNFDLLNKSETIDKNILKQIFVNYGKFHGLTFAFKDQNIEKYLEIICPLRDIFVEFGTSAEFMGAMDMAFKAAYEALKEIDTEKGKLIEKYAENVKEHYHNTKVYTGKFSSLVHGDCWSNNMLFKYGENEAIEDIKFIDLQLCRDSTPIHDLAYFFYSGASKEDFDKLDEYLEIYHKSFSAFAIELGSDPEKLLPLSILKAEWKQHSQLGLFMGIMLWQVKLLHKDQITDVHTAEGGKTFLQKVRGVLESETFKRNTSDILVHAIEFGIL